MFGIILEFDVILDCIMVLLEIFAVCGMIPAYCQAVVNTKTRNFSFICYFFYNSRLRNAKEVS